MQAGDLLGANSPGLKEGWLTAVLGLTPAGSGQNRQLDIHQGVPDWRGAGGQAEGPPPRSMNFMHWSSNLFLLNIFLLITEWKGEGEIDTSMMREHH